MDRSELQVEEIFHTEDRYSVGYLELPLSRKTFVLVGVAVLFICLVVVLRIGQLSVLNFGAYVNRANGNAREEIVIPAARGVIVDRFGKVLADNKGVFSVWIDTSKVLKNREGLEELIRDLSEIAGIDEGDIREKIESVNVEYQPFARVIENIDNDVVIDLKSRNIFGVQVVEDYARNYYKPKVFSHILGYGGVAGLEKYYDDQLKGVNGRRVIYEDAIGVDIEDKQVIEPKSGSMLHTSIDADLQEYFYNRLGSGLEALGRTSGAGIAMNPKTGEILSLISMPSYDNSNLVPYLNAPNQPLFNRAVSGEYNPGSTIKPIHALAALKEGVVGPEDRFFSSGRLEVPNPYDPESPSVFLDWAPHGWVDLHSALARSSNVYFYHIGGGFNSPELKTTGLGIERLNKYWKIFGLGEKIGVDFPAEGTGFIPNAEEKESRTGSFWRVGDTYNVSIGQGDLLLTPLQLISLISSIGQGGKIYQPHFVETNKPKVLFDYSSWSEEVSAVQEGLYDAVRMPYGTANLLSSLPMTSAGKTGSAQVSNNTRTNAFFVGYAPAENPDIAVLVLIENALEGSLNAVPIARDVLGWYYENRLR
jgi:penicillin-binding protein 2